MILDIEIRLKNHCTVSKDELIALAKQSMPTAVENEKPFLPPAEPSGKLNENIENISITCHNQPIGADVEFTPGCLETANYFVYTTKDFGAMAEEIGNGNNDEANTIGSYQWELPTTEFNGLWESLIYGMDECPKLEITNFIKTTMEFSQYSVDPTILPQNRLILLNGPPGTGKTTLCKAIAQRLAIRMQSQYKRVLLIEVNSHSLFSKWFSESGKLIQKLFTRIEELAEQQDWLIFVLIDEVESLTMGREASFSGTDPTDSVRAVNAVLTQLDKIKRHSNVFILCTSNIEKALDSAFIDRIGLIRYIGHPSEQATVAILANCIQEMRRTGLLINTHECSEENMANRYREIARHCVRAQLSGRALRKLPVPAFSAARHKSGTMSPNGVDLAIFLDCLQREAEKEEARKFGSLNVMPPTPLTIVNGGINLDSLVENLPQL